MSYDIKCRKCNRYTFSENIVDLIDNHTGKNGFFICEHCKSDDTFIYRESEAQEGFLWKRWLKGIIRIDSGEETFSPYVFYLADEKNAKPTEYRLQFQYYKDDRPSGGKLKHGHGPGGGPVLEKDDLFFIFQNLIKIKALSIGDLKKFTNRLDKYKTRKT
jgi:hypothetical protein